jgi:hypothetical protein
MLEAGDFVVICLVMFAIAALLVVGAGLSHRFSLGTPPEGKKRRDRIADGAVTPEEVDAMMKAENARLKASGRRTLTRAQVESRIVGDDGFRRRVGRLRHRRRPERARPLA